MYFQFLVEDRSTEILVDHVLKKIRNESAQGNLYYGIKSFKGIGTVSNVGTVRERKTGKLLNDLPLYLRAFSKSLAPQADTAIVIVLDNDQRDPEEFQKQLEEIAASSMMLIDHVFCIAIKETEAWLLGDANAIQAAYPAARMSALSRYKQDAIEPTWEVLADVVYPGGCQKLKKKAGGAYTEIGRAKSEWADSIGQRLNIRKNNSPSFNRFVDALLCRAEGCSSRETGLSP